MPRSAYTTRRLNCPCHRLLPLLLAVVGALGASSSASARSRVQLDSTWRVAGPYPVGKTELDAWPLGQLTLLDLISSNASLPLPPSELVKGAVVAPAVLHAGQNGMVEYAPNVDWNRLVQALSAVEVLEFQAIAWTALHVPRRSRVKAACLGVVGWYLIDPNGRDSTFAGDIYQTGRISYSLALDAGDYHVAALIRGKAQASFRCTFASEASKGALQILSIASSPDIWGGKVFGDTLSLAVGLHGVKEATSLHCEVIQADVGIAWHASTKLQPLHEITALGRSSLMLPCLLRNTLVVDTCSESETVAIRVRVVATENATNVESPWFAHTLRCRSLHQSAMFAFIDHDGSAQTAAVVAPLHFGALKPTAEVVLPSDIQAIDALHGVPVLLSMHGTGVSASSQADAYKVMPPGSKSYIFGVEGYWLLAPSRHGAHNWQGIGQWHALHALQALRLWVKGVASPGSTQTCGTWRDELRCLPQVDDMRILFSGHSMGGAGAWHIATAFSDVAIAAAPIAGWLVKEGYGDANTFMKLDAAEPFVDAVLKGVLLSTVQDQRADSHAANLRGVPVHVRVGTEDMTTPAFYSRRMVRMLHAASAGVAPERMNESSPAIEEVRGKEHWWWDTRTSNDGGVVNDAVMRKFYAAHRARISSAAGWRYVLEDSVQLRRPSALATPHTLPADFQVVTTNPAVYSRGRAGIHIEALEVPARKAVASVQLRDHPLDWWIMRVAHIRTSNVAVLRLGFTDSDAELPRAFADRVKLAAQDLRRVCAAAAVQQGHPAQNATIPSYPFVIPAGFCVDGTAIPLASLRRSAFCRMRLGDGFQWTSCHARDTDTNVQVHADGVVIQPDDNARVGLEYAFTPPGPLRAVTAAPFAVVVAENASVEEQRVATLVSLLHLSAYDTFAPVVHVQTFISQLGHNSGVRDGWNGVFVGQHTWREFAATTGVAARQGVDLGVAGDSRCLAVRIHPHVARWCGGDVAAVVRVPLQARGNSYLAKGSPAAPLDIGSSRQGMVLFANSQRGWRTLARLALPTIPPMVRAPFTNLFPDVLVVDSTVDDAGAGGILAAGYWNASLAGLVQAASYVRE